MEEFRLSKEACETYSADGRGKSKSADGENLVCFWISVQRDSQIPEFDTLKGLKFYVEGFDDQQKYLETLIEMVTEFGGMFVEDILKLSEKDVFSAAREKIHPKDIFAIPALHALKKAICDYLKNTDQNERLKRATEKVVCNCRYVTDHDIKDIVAKGKTTFEEVQKFTGAGSGCGSCINKVKEILTS